MKKHILIWLALILGELIAITVLAGSTTIDKILRSDIEKTAAFFGTDQAALLVQRTNTAFNATLGTRAAQSNSLYISDREKRTSSQLFGGVAASLSQKTNDTLHTFWQLLYQVTFRLQIAVLWLPAIAILALAAAVDGVMQRRIKKASFHDINPAYQGMALHVLIAMCLGPIVFILAPVSLTPLVYPIWASLMTLPLMITLSHAGVG